MIGHIFFLGVIIASSTALACEENFQVSFGCMPENNSLDSKEAIDLIKHGVTVCEPSQIGDDLNENSGVVSQGQKAYARLESDKDIYLPRTQHIQISGATDDVFTNKEYQVKLSYESQSYTKTIAEILDFKSGKTYTRHLVCWY